MLEFLRSGSKQTRATMSPRAGLDLIQVLPHVSSPPRKHVHGQVGAGCVAHGSHRQVAKRCSWFEKCPRKPSSHVRFRLNSSLRSESQWLDPVGIRNTFRRSSRRLSPFTESSHPGHVVCFVLFGAAKDAMPSLRSRSKMDRGWSCM